MIESKQTKKDNTMLSNICLENFKCFQKQSVPLSNFTLLTGFNAAGKSTVLQTLLLASQMARNEFHSGIALLNGDLVRLGTTGDVLSHYATEKKIILEFTNDLHSIVIELDASTRSKMGLPIINHSDVLKMKKISPSLFNHLHDVIYLSAMRIGTEDVFPIPDNPNLVNADVGFCGEFAPWWFDQNKDEIVPSSRCHPKEESKYLSSQFNAWSSELFPGSQANAVQVTKTPLVRLELRTRNTEDWKRPANIGYGLTYAFPIIVAGLLAKKGQVLIVDSPEAHLHPRGQSKIGEFLSTVAASGVQVIIETHSDHVLNGMRLAVYKKKLKAKNVTVHFFTSSSDDLPSIIMPSVDNNGNLSEWPEGFFDQSDKDLAALSGWSE